MSPHVKICIPLTEETKFVPKNHPVHFWQFLMTKLTHVHLMFTFLLQNTCTCFCNKNSNWLQLLLAASS